MRPVSWPNAPSDLRKRRGASRRSPPPTPGKNGWPRASPSCNARFGRAAMAERITDEDLELLGDLGVETAPAPTGGRSPREQRIIAGFEEIVRFVAEHGRAPQHGENGDIFER